MRYDRFHVWLGRFEEFSSRFSDSRFFDGNGGSPETIVTRELTQGGHSLVVTLFSYR